MQIETLGVDFTTGTGALISWGVITSSIGSIASNALGTRAKVVPPSTILYANLAIIGLVLIGIVIDIAMANSKSGEEHDLFIERLGAIHIGLALGTFSTLVDRAKTDNWGSTLRKTIDAYPYYGKLIKLVDGIGGPSIVGTILGYLFKEVLDGLSKVSDGIGLLKEFLNFNLVSLANFAITFAII